MEWLMIVAVLIAPITAVQIQRWIEDYRRKSDRKEWIFKTLMATRAEGLNRDHVNALNLIDLEYYKDKKGRRVVDKWREYLDQLGSFPDDGSQDGIKRWSDRREELFTDMLYEMASRLGYKFDKVILRRGVYSPKAYGDLEIDQSIIRKGIVQILNGHSVVPIQLVLSEEDRVRQTALQNAMTKHYGADMSHGVDDGAESEMGSGR